VHVGDTLAYIGEESELSNIKQTQQQPQAPQPVQTSAQTAQGAPAKSVSTQQQARPQEITATPYIRKLARDNNIDISKVIGTGPGGRILENDVMNLVGKAPQAMQGQAPKFLEGLEAKHPGEIERVPMSQTRKAIARNLELSLSIPTFTHTDLINADNLYGTVKMEKPNAEKLGVKLTFLPFIIKATVEALKENPAANASYDRDRQEIILKKYYNIGLAAQAPDGLKIIVIKDADKKNIIQIAKEIQVLHEKINNKTITIDEMKDTSFTITNVGSIGRGFISIPIINPPDVGILGVSMIKDQPIVGENGEIRAAKIMPFSLVFDHRVVDGADAVKFGATLVKRLEDPEFLKIVG
jgi:pyruvate dehydrogenase E2 component (dihydrolipoamide acetyltransferase)